MLAAEVPVDDFAYGWITPVFAFVMAVLGAALGLRCTVRALTLDPARRFGWLLLGAVAIGTGIFTMHFIAMMGFAAESVVISYDLDKTYASLVVAVLVVGLGVFLVGYAPRSTMALLGGGLITGLGVAAMHYMGMAGMRLTGELRYDPAIVGLSLAIALVAATAALWFAITVRGFGASLGASLVMGVAVSGMHYTGMSAVSVHAHALTNIGGRSGVEILLPALMVPVLLLVFIGLFVGLDPMTTQEIQAKLEQSRIDREAASGGRGGRPAPAAGPAAMPGGRKGTRDPAGSRGTVR
jgi:NO-binding membrane sensor protein with MHYT domain